MKLFLVESPNKCSTIRHILGSGYKVEASIGHITTLARDGEDNLGFDISRTGIECRYIPNGDRGSDVIKKLRKLAKDADEVLIATDPDREGESIAWHIKEQICQGKPYRRVTYTQITESAIKAAIASARTIDDALVDAQKARQCLDKLVGFKLSGLVQRANAGKSAGRVQSAALHILCKREREIKGFKPTPYWSIQSQYGEGFRAYYLGSDQSAVNSSQEDEVGADDATDPSASSQAESSRVLSEQEAKRIVEIAQANSHQVIEFSGKQAQKAPPPALTTSALQQVVGVKYGFSSDQTMKYAQELFEGMKLPDGSTHGAITYHRTDSVELSPEFCESVREWLSQHEPDLVPAKATKHKTKEGAQGAHEAIRPVDVSFTPDVMKNYLSEPQLKVYTVIWQRAVASQCASAQLEKSKAVIKAGSTLWEARGSVLKSPGYTRIWGNLGDDSQLPQLQDGQSLSVQKVWHEAKKTSPPGRYSEPSLVQTLERLGIGRPSTYASIMKTLKDREYVKLEKKMMVPTAAGMKVDECLIEVFPAVTDNKFTATMEAQLDAISEGKRNWEEYLIKFNFEFFQPALAKQGAEVIARSQKKSEVKCPGCNKPLTERMFRDPSKLKDLPKDYYLICTEGCQDMILFWNRQLDDWVQKGREPQKLEVTPGKPTEFICQVCGKPLEEYAYQKEGQTKTMLRCSDATARRQADHKDEVYFKGKKGYWNFAREAEPTTEPPVIGRKSKPRGEASNSKSGKPPIAMGKKKTE
jgi:DNA topoisomerase I